MRTQNNLINSSNCDATLPVVTDRSDGRTGRRALVNRPNANSSNNTSSKIVEVVAAILVCGDHTCATATTILTIKATD